MTIEEMRRIAETPAWPHDQTWANVEALAKYSETFGPPCIKRLLRVCAAAKELLADVADYPAWQRPCNAVDETRASLAALEEEGG